VLLLGVTPELFAMRWPLTTVVAVDRSQEMLDLVWPGSRGAARRAAWTALPLRAASCDIVLCDGGLHLLRYPTEQQALVAELCRVVPPGGACVFRLFVPPANREPVEAILADLRADQPLDINVIKLRMAMALQSSPDEGVRVRDVWHAISAVAPDGARQGWSAGEMATLDAYRHSDAVYSFVTVDEVEALFGWRGSFALESVRFATYELGDRCPIVSLRRQVVGST
jgi:SAM-dependent methyltransferase